ncbi:MAG: glycosyltransferase family 39 protein [bacterium]|nr:glycosyltransferase family 39 protein [bacterium]
MKGAGAILGVTALILCAAVLRFHGIDSQSLWHDEGNSVVQAGRSLADIAYHAGRDIHPPGYYWMLAVWRAVFGESELALRSLSAFASTITVALGYAIGRRLMPNWAAGLAAALIALNTFSIYYAQEARMYALLGLWAAGAAWSLVMWLNLRNARRAWRWALAYALCSAAGLWTHYAFPFVLAALGILALIVLFKRNRRRWFAAFAAANALALALFAAWLPTAWSQISGWGQAGGALPFQEAAAVIGRWLAFGVTGEPLTLAIPLLLVIAGTLAWPAARRGPAWPLPILLTGVPLALFFAFGLARETNFKFLLPAQVGAALWMARGVWAISRLGERRPDATAVGAMARLAALAAALWMLVNLGAGVPPLYTDSAYQRTDYRTIARLLEAQAAADDAIILNAPSQSEVFTYYYDGAAQVYPLPIGLNADEQATGAALDTILEAAGRIDVLFWGEDQRDPARQVERTLAARAYEIDQRWVGDVRVARYLVRAALPGDCPAGLAFGGVIRLERCRIGETTVSPGAAIPLAFGWDADASADTARYKLFIQLLNADGVLVAQRDSEPAGGWQGDPFAEDRHALAIPPTLPPGTYTLILGVYERDDPAVRLRVGDGDYAEIATITVRGA